jgi:lysyl-tRNA synthetase class 2
MANPHISPVWHPERLAARMPFLRARAALATATRAFFAGRGYLEVETPALVPSPGAEVHLMAFETRFVPHLGQGKERRLFLRTSPELAIKRLLAGGAGPVFELARVWRNGEASHRHAPEFTMLEWYRPGASMASLMGETEAFLRAVWPVCPTAPFTRLTMAEAFDRYVDGLDILATIRPDGTGDAQGLIAAAAARGLTGPADEDWESAFFRLLLERIDPALGAHPTFLTHWPTPQAALARRDAADPRAALRFELYVDGLELANAFEELTDPAEQRRRLVFDMAERERQHGPESAWPVDEDFLAALEHGMPPTSGIALGFDRLAMLVSGAKRIGDVQWLPWEEQA